MFSTPPFIPQFGTGAPSGPIPTNQLYFDVTGSDYIGYVFNAGTFHPFGATGGTGTVTSVGLSLPASTFTITGSPVTGMGTLTGSFAVQTANTFLAGPTSGASATPAWRALANSDMPWASSFTQGSVIFAGASGALAQDNAQFFWDDTNHRLGMGTTTPQCPVDLNFTNGQTLPTPAVGTGARFGGAGTAGNNFRFFFYETIATNSAFFGRRTNGTYAAPTALLSGNIITSIAATGYDGTTLLAASRASFQFIANENWTSTATGTDFALFLTAAGGITTTEKLRIYGDGRAQLTGAIVDLSYSYQTPSTGFTITPGNTVGRLLLNPAGVLATGTITMPSAPKDGQVLKIKSSQAVTALTLSPNAGQTIADPIATLAAGVMYEYTYVGSVATWV